jgi:hypothetical protein
MIGTTHISALGGLSVLLAGVLSTVACARDSQGAFIFPSQPSSTAPAPATISVSPSSVAAGHPDLQITILAAGPWFHSSNKILSTAMWEPGGDTPDTPLPTEFISMTEVRAVIPSELMKHPVGVRIYVLTYDKIEDARSHSPSAPFIVTN